MKIKRIGSKAGTRINIPSKACLGTTIAHLNQSTSYQTIPVTYKDFSTGNCKASEWVFINRTEKGSHPCTFLRVRLNLQSRLRELSFFFSSSLLFLILRSERYAPITIVFFPCCRSSGNDEAKGERKQQKRKIKRGR